jgi:hypothetical protein
MTKTPNPEIDIKYCPFCRESIYNVPRHAMKSRGYIRKDGSISEFTNTYDCMTCKRRFDIKPRRLHH